MTLLLCPYAIMWTVVETNLGGPVPDTVGADRHAMIVLQFGMNTLSFKLQHTTHMSKPQACCCTSAAGRRFVTM